MKQLLLIVLSASIAYGCNETAGKEPRPEKPFASPATHKSPPEELRVGRMDAKMMRDRRKGDDAAVKISAQDLLSLMQGAPASTDSFIFYFVKYDPNSDKDRGRYARKGHDADWGEVGKKPSSLLVGFISGQNNPGMYLAPRPARATVSVYDLGVVCPPPPDCNCDIAQ